MISNYNKTNQQINYFKILHLLQRKYHEDLQIDIFKYFN